MAQNRFASVPNISIPRSRFKQPFNHSTTFLHGQLIPIDCFEVLPGDTFKLDLASLIWMSNPIRPIFGNITAHVDCFFVPMRLVWSSTQEFFGENKTTSGYSVTTYEIPSIRLGYGTTNHAVAWNSIAHYFGKPICSGFTSYRCAKVSVLKERGYLAIWNDYYRAQQLQNPYIINLSGNGAFADSAANYLEVGGSYTFNSGPLSVNKEFDYFTAATVYPQYGPAVELPLGSFAPVVTNPISNLSDVDPSVIEYAKKGNSGLKWLNTGVSSPVLKVGGDWSEEKVTNIVLGSSNTRIGMTSAVDSTATDIVAPANLMADLSQATAATINELRYAFAVQKYLERANFGSRFYEMLQVHYGVSSPDASLQLPQRVGHADIPINISTVLSTAGATDDTSTALGMPGASSCTANKRYMTTHAFTEPGFFYVLISTTHERSYTQGIMREDLRASRYEIYSPEFANLGDQEIKNCEIFYADDNYNFDAFGYQEHWAEYRYRPHRVSGMLDPQATGALDFWVLTDNYGLRPQLNGSWIAENRTALANCLVSGLTGPDYVCDFYFDYTATREMPLFTIPGLIDHFGVR